MVAVFQNDINILKENIKILSKKKICWVRGCSNEAISLNINFEFYNWLISKENKYFHIKERYDEVIIELLKNNYKVIWWFYCLEHEVGWSRYLVPTIDKNSNYKKIKNIFHKWQEKFYLIDVSYCFVLNIHFFLSKYKEKKFKIEEYFSDEERKIIDPEKIWLKDYAYFVSIPINIKKNFYISKYNGTGTSNQGKYNGPDFMFKNKATRQTIGLEIVEYQPLIFNVEKIRDIEKFISILDNSMAKKMRINTNKKMDKINEIINKKIIKAGNYEKTDQLCLAIILNHAIKGSEYYWFEFWTTLNWKNGLNNSPFLDIYFF